MAAFFMPRMAFAPAHCSPCRSYSPYSVPSRNSSLQPFLSLLDDAFGEIDREVKRQVRREARRQRPFHAKFDIRETGEGYQVIGDVPGFTQENIDIEVSDEYTLKISGSTERNTETPAQTEVDRMEIEPSTPTAATATETSEKTVETPQSPRSETSSVKSYQPTVEDDYEDLGAETEHAPTTSSKGNEKAVDEPKSEKNGVVVPVPEPQAPSQKEQHQPEQRSWLSERSYGSFSRTFTFPERIDASNARASLKNGLLTLSIPKAPRPQVSRIMIQ